MTARRVQMPAFVLLPLAAALLLAGCAGPRRAPGDTEPTLATLRDRSVAVAPDPLDSRLTLAEDQTIAAYREFLDSAPRAPQRPEAQRRLGDLEMDRADRLAADGKGSAARPDEPDYSVAVARYEAYLREHPDDPRNDRVLYQLARAHESAGRMDAALAVLTRLVQRHPGTLHADEAHFRRGEMLFALGRWADAEAAYATVLAQGRQTPFTERALYMQGWSLFKQAKLEQALEPFFGVLDLKLGKLPPRLREEPELEAIAGLTRADRELLEDTFRVVGISLANLKGPESIPPLVNSPQREGYEFRVYQQLAGLYLRQERVKDAADTLTAFVRRQPMHAQAPQMAARVVGVYTEGGFAALALQAKREHVQRYGRDSEYRRANPSGWREAQPVVKAYLTDLTQHHHAQAQRSKAKADVDEALAWYREWLASFPADAQAAGQRFLMAELLFDDRRFAAAAEAFEQVAYPAAGAPAFARAADAGYSALLAVTELERGAAGDAAARAPLRQRLVQASLRFADTFAADTRGAPVLVNAAEQLLALGEGARAVTVAQRALALQPPPAPELRRVAWTVVAQQAFDDKAYAQAEQAFGEVLALTAPAAPGRAALVERQAAAIYRQGELAREGGDGRAAVGHFARVAALAALPAGSPLRATALFDSAASLLALKDWPAAAAALEDFRRQHPGHALQAEVPARLALAYLESGRPQEAAAEFERVAAASTEPEVARSARWQVATLRQRAAEKAPAKSPLIATARQAWERYLQAHPQPVEPAVQARWALAELAAQDGQAPRATAWLRAVQAADREAGDARTPLTRSLGGQATLKLAEPLVAAYRAVPLIEPLQKQLKLKKARMDTLLKAYAEASEAGVPDVVTAATFHTAALYQDFGKAMLGSQRPRGLKKLELEQYNVMLEEQAFPFEEKAIELHELNARRTTQGLWEPFVQQSLAELAKLKPGRWARLERADAALPSEVPAVQKALAAQPGSVALLNQLGVAERRQGRFDAARAAYEAALAADPAAVAPRLNLGILYDLYLGDVAQAQAQYQRALELSPADAQPLGRWLAELKTRKPAAGAPTPPAPQAAATPAPERKQP